MTEKLFPIFLKTTYGTKWGYMNRSGRTRISTIYDKAFSFQSNGLAIIKLDGQYGLINRHGRYIVNPIYQEIRPFSGSKAVVRTKTGYSVINDAGKILTKKNYGYIAQMRNNRLLFQENNEYGYLNERGEEVIPAAYLKANEFETEYTTVQTRSGQYFLIDIYGNTIQTYPFSKVGALSEERIPFKSDQNSKWGFLSKSGKQVIEPLYDRVFAFFEGVAIISQRKSGRDYYGLINKKGNLLIEPIHEEIMLLGTDRLALGKTDNSGENAYMKYAMYTVSGERLTEHVYTYMGPFGKNGTCVSDGKQTQLMDSRGKLKGPAFLGFGMIENLDGLYCVYIDNRIFYSTYSGETVWKDSGSMVLRNPYMITELSYRPRSSQIVYYPRVEGISNKKEQESLNEWLKQATLSEPEEDKKGNDYYYSGDYNVLFFKKHLLSLQLIRRGFSEGDGTLSEKQIHAVIDLRDGYRYRLSDLFKPNQSYKMVLDRFIQELIKQEGWSASNHSFEGLSENQDFTIHSDRLNIIYKFNSTKTVFHIFEISLADIDPIINKNGRMWESFHLTLHD